MSKVIRITIDGGRYTFKELSRRYGVPANRIRERYYQHKRGHDLITPHHLAHKISFHGKYYTIRALAHKYHISKGKLYSRYYKGYQDDDLLEPPYQNHNDRTIHRQSLAYGQQSLNALSQDKPSNHSSDSTRTGLSLDRAIHKLETINGIQFSDEQRAILRAPKNHPVVVNACAGSGKTTIFIYKAILNMLIGRSNGEDTLGITFSKAAQLEMEHRFYAIRSQLVQAGVKVQALLDSTPRFRTFHALFFHLLKKHQPDLKVLTNPTGNYHFTRTFYQILNRSHYDTDNKEVLKQMFALRDELIDRGWSVDGLTIPEYDGYKHPVQAVSPQLNISGHSSQFYRDYVTIIRVYQDMKANAGRIDFTDMKVILYQEMTNDPAAKDRFQRDMDDYRYVFLDEFQDIDNLQWRLIKLLLSLSARRNLFVIGDDDQAIYGFRGGSAHYIINFPHEFSDAQPFHLSTNYRTGGKILGTAQPMIQRNPVRIKKELQAYHKGHGKIYTNHADDHTELKDDPVFYRLLKFAQDSHIDKQDIAVLVRHNTTRSMVADFLANHGIYGDISHPEFILQRTKIYQTYMDLMQAFLYDDFSLFYRHASEIGFRKYRSHIKSLAYRQQIHLSQVEKLSIYCAMTRTVYDKSNEKDIDDTVLDDYRAAQTAPKNDTAQNRNLLELLYKLVHELIKSYYGYMIKKQFISKDDYQMARSLLESNIQHHNYYQIDDFFQREKGKENHLAYVISHEKEKDLDILTLHQAKGLQYKYVFLIGLNDIDFAPDSLKHARMFPSNTSYGDFLKIIHDNLPLTKDDEELSDIETTSKDIWYHSKDDETNRIPSEAFEDMYNSEVRGVLPPEHDDDIFHFVTKEHYVENHRHPIQERRIVEDADGSPIIPPKIEYIDKSTGEILPTHRVVDNQTLDRYRRDTQEIYRIFLHNSEFVEGERRLLYVGVTRSQDELYLDVPESPSPLLAELNVKEASQAPGMTQKEKERAQQKAHPRTHHSGKDLREAGWDIPTLNQKIMENSYGHQ